MTPNGRMTVTTAVACVLVSSVLLPLFTNTLWFVIGAGAVIAVAGTGALTRLRTLPVSVCLAATVDRKSTRLNSSHLVISYAVFCLKKKKKQMLTCLLQLHL